MSEQLNTTDKFITVKTAFGYQKKPNPNYIATNGEIPRVQRTIAQVDADRRKQDNLNVKNTTEAKGFGVSGYGYGGYLRKGKKLRSTKRRNNRNKSSRSRKNKRQTKRSRR
jgi:hypothetical protein